MAEPTSQKIEPVIVGKSGPQEPQATVVAMTNGGGIERQTAEQLARIEEKAARIEDKFARAESLLLRVQATFEDAMAEFGNLARRSDVAAIEQKIRRVPGVGAMLFFAILTGIIAAALTIAAFKYGIPGVLPPGSAPASLMPPAR